MSKNRLFCLLVAFLPASLAAQQVTVSFIDADGAKATSYVESSRVFVRVDDRNANLTPTAAETVSVTLTTALAADLETLTLTETGVNTALFEGEIDLTTVLPAFPDGTLQTGSDFGPPFTYDTLQVDYQHSGGTATDTAAITGSATRLLDAHGNDASAYPLGGEIRLEVHDANRNDPLLVDQVQADVLGLANADFEGVTLTETGFDTGIFTASLATSTGAASGGDGVLQVAFAETVEARHPDANGPTESIDSATMAGSSVEVVDAAGKPAAEVLESSRLFVRVFDLAQNTNPLTPDQTFVDLDSALGGDQEGILLTETGDSTAVFEGSIGLRLTSPGFATPGDQVLETSEEAGPPFPFDTLTATHFDSFGSSAAAVTTLGSRTFFVDVFGQSAAEYGIGASIVVRVEDHNANDPASFDFIGVDVFDSLALLGSGDFESLELQETGRDTALFEGTLPLVFSGLGPVSGDGVLDAPAGRILIARRHDLFGLSMSEDQATVTSTAVEWIDADGLPAEVFLENGLAHVRLLDTAANANSLTAETTTVTLTSARTGDVETLEVTETGADTGVFTGSIHLVFAPGALPENGELEVSNSGSPEFEPDTVTASSADASDTARTVGSFADFVDEQGRPTASYPLGATLHLRVEDPQRNDPVSVDTLVVDLRGLTGLDTEAVTLTETGFDTGIFTGATATVTAPLIFGDGVLAVGFGEIVELRHVNVNTPADTVDQATVTGSTVDFIDAAGNSAEVYLESGRVFVRVFDAAADGNEFAADTTFVDLSSELGGDLEGVQLTETGDSTAVFEGSIGMQLTSPGLATQGNGVLETSEQSGPPFLLDTLTATHFDNSGGLSTDTATTLGSRTVFVDASGAEVESYAVGSTVYLRVEDQNSNDPSSFDFLGVDVRSLSSGDSEQVELQETARDSGVFEGTLPLRSGVAQTANGTLEVGVGETIEAEHFDLFGLSTSTDRATVTDTAVEWIDADGLPAEVFLENGVAYIRAFDAGANSDPFIAEATTVQVTSLLAGDSETVTLFETGLDTSRFEGSIRLPFSFAAFPGNGELEVFNSTPPEFIQDTLTVSTVDATDTARTAGSRIDFVDGLGRETTSYPVGGTIYLRLEDHNGNSPTAIDTVVVDLRGLTGLDAEAVTLTETSFDTGIFTVSVSSGADFPSPGDGVLQVSLGEVLEARYVNFNTPADTVDQATVTGSTVDFIDAAGNSTEVFLESGRVYVRVFDAAADGDSFAPDTTFVDLSSELGGDLEGVQLTETGDSTAVFEGSIGMQLTSPAFATQGNGVLETSEEAGPPFLLDTLTATHFDNFFGGTSTDTATTLGSRTAFVDALGSEVESYAVGSTVYLRVEDRNFNDPSSFDFLGVDVRSLSSGDFEQVELQETARDSGVFEGTLPLRSGVAQTANGTLEVGVGETIEAEHFDLFGLSTSTDRATVTDTSVEWIDAEGRPAEVFLENGVAHIRAFDAGANFDPFFAEATTVQVTSLLAGDSETVTLFETGLDTSRFEGSIRLPFSSTAFPGNGELEVANSGSPEFIQDTLTVTTVDSTDTARTAGSRIDFVDGLGRETTSYPVGGTIYLRLEDHNGNSPTAIDTVVVDLRGLTGLDAEAVTLTETSFDTGIFIASVSSGADFPSPGDAVLQVSLGEALEARYVNFNTPADTVDQATVTGSTTQLIDATGNSTEVFLESGRVYVRVFDAAADGDSFAPDTTFVDLSSELGGDLEGVQLTETGDSTAVFEGSIGMQLTSPGLATQGNGVFETSEEAGPPFLLDTLTATHFDNFGGTSTDTATTLGSRTAFVDASGSEVESYAVGSTVYLRVEDQTSNDPSSFDFLGVDVRSLSSGDFEQVELQETARDSGVFEGTLPLRSGVAQTANGTLEVGVGETIEAEHFDLFGLSTSTDRATVTDTSVEWIDAEGQPAEVFLENGVAHIRAFDAGANFDPFFAETTTVQVSSLLVGDSEIVTLSETGLGTSVFEGSIRLPFSFAAFPGNGELEVFNSTPPEFIQDTLTVSTVDASDTARTVGSAIDFVDAGGVEVDTYPVGSRVHVRLEDHNRNDPSFVDTVVVDVRAETNFGIDDFESLTLSETGFDTGVFEGSLDSLEESPNSGNGLLEVSPGKSLEVRHFNLNSPAEMVDTATFTGSSVTFLDAAGNPAQVFLESSTVFVRVVDDAAELDPFAPDTIFADLTSLLGVDLEAVMLTETGNSTGIYEGSIPLALSSPGLAAQGNGVLETSEVAGPPHQFDTLAVTYFDARGGASTAAADTLASRTSFTDAFGNPVERYATGSQVFVRVEDHNFNDPGSVDSVGVDVSAQLYADSEQVNLTETGLDTGVFTGSLPLELPDGIPNPGDGVLETDAGDTLEALHFDFFGLTESRDQANVRGVRVEFVDAAGVPTETYLEGGRVHVRLFDRFSNFDPATPDQIGIEITASLSGDIVNLLLDETGPNSSVFEGSVPMQFSPTPVCCDLMLQTSNSGSPEYRPDTLTAIASGDSADNDTASVVASRSRFVNAVGEDTDTFPLGGRVHVVVEDQNRNDPALVETLAARVIGQMQGDIETLTLTETAADSGVFTGSVPSQENFVVSSESARLEVRLGEPIRVSHGNLNSPTESSDTAAMALNRSPNLVEDTATTEEDTPVVIPVLANDSDPDGELLSVIFVGGGSFGSTTLNPDGTVTYTPDVNFNGVDSFFYYAVDGSQEGNSVTVSVTVTAVNDAPVAANDTATTAEDTPVVIAVLANDSDVDGDTLTVSAVTPGASGTVGINPDDTLTYTPSSGVSGGDSFTYTVDDGNGGTAVGTVSVTVTPVNDAPVAANDTATTAEDTPVVIAVLANDSDADGDPLTVSAVTQGANGTVVINPDNTVTYTPNADFNGSDTFTYTVSDGNGGTAVGSVTVTVIAVNDAPVAVGDTATTAEETAVVIAVLANDSDADGDTLTVTGVTQGTSGTVGINPDNTLTYTPSADFNGNDTFTYTASDGNGGTAVGTVSVTVTAVNDAPVAVNDTVATNEDVAVAVAVLANDGDVDGDLLTVTSVTQGALGTVGILPDGTLLYTPSANVFGADTFSYTVADGNGGTASAAVAVTVVPVNDDPVAAADAAETRENTPVNLDVLANDTDLDGDSLSVASVTAGTGGSPTLETDGTVTFTPDDNFTGDAAFTYTVSDGNGGSAGGAVTVSVAEALERVVVLATNSVFLGDGAAVLSGDVIANATSAGPVLDSGVELSVGLNVTTAAGYDLEGDDVEIDLGAVVDGDVHFNLLTNNGTVTGAQVTPLTLPVFSDLPPFPTPAPGTQDVSVRNNRLDTLTPGPYRDITVGKNATLVLTGGVYEVRSVFVDRGGRILYAGAGEMRIAGRLATAATSGVGPDTGSALGAGDFIFYVAGINGTGGGLTETPEAVLLEGDVRAALDVPNGTLRLGDGIVARGSFLARDVAVGAGAQLTLEAFYLGQ